MSLPDHLKPRYDYRTPEEMRQHFEEAGQWAKEHGTPEDVQEMKEAREGLETYIETLKKMAEQSNLNLNSLFRTSLTINYHVHETARANNCDPSQITHDIMYAPEVEQLAREKGLLP